MAECCICGEKGGQYPCPRGCRAAGMMHLKCLPHHFHINQVLLEVLLDLWEVPRDLWEPLLDL